MSIFLHLNLQKKKRSILPSTFLSRDWNPSNRTIREIGLYGVVWKENKVQMQQSSNTWKKVLLMRQNVFISK